MAAPFFEATANTGLNDLFSSLRSALLGVSPSPWVETVLNSSVAAPVAGTFVRESIFQLPANAAQENQVGGGFIGIARGIDGSGNSGLWLYAHTGQKGPITINTISRTGTLVTVTTTTNHGLATNDIVYINGTSQTTFNQGNGTNDAAGQITVTGLQTFTYTSPVSGTTNGTGGSVVAVYNAAGSRTTSVGDGRRINITDTPNAVYGYCDAFRICGVVQQGAQNRLFYLGWCGREHVQTAGSSCFVSNSSISVGANTVTADRTPANLYIGQPLWIVDTTTANNEVTTVSNIVGNQISFTAVNSYGAGAICGWDPEPLVVMALGGSANTTSSTTSYSAYACLDQKGGRTAAQTAVVDVTMAWAVELYSISGEKLVTNPDSAGFYQGRDLALLKNTAPVGTRKYMPGMVAFPLGSQNEFDIQRIGGVPITTDYKAFVSQTATDQASATYATCFGPGATNP